MAITRGPKIVKNGLVLALDAADTNSYIGSGTTWKDLSGNGNGTLTNGPLFNTLNGGSIFFDGVNDCVILPVNSIYNFGSGDFSIFCWIRTSKISDYSTIFALDDGASGNGVLFYINITTGTFRPYVAGVVQNTTQSIANGIWNHVGITRRSGVVYQYINGIQVGNFSSTGSIITNQIPRFGNYNNTATYSYQGNIAISHIYNIGLTDAQVLQNYNSTKIRFNLAYSIVMDSLGLYLDASIENSYIGSGTSWIDLSGYGNNGTLTNGPTFNASNGGSIVFDGTNDYVSVSSSSSVKNSTNLSIDAWFYYSGTGLLGIIGKGASDADEEYSLLVSSTNIYFDIGNAVGPYTYPSYSLSSNTWYHIAATHERIGSSSTLKIYINGTFLNNSTSAATSSVNSNSSNVTIGSRFSDAGFFNGRISKIRIYTKTLSSTEVLQNYNVDKSRFEL
jgi:hypothetical protein